MGSRSGRRSLTCAIAIAVTAIGLSAQQLRTISYGKERRVCTYSEEVCWQKNRRVHFSRGD